AVGVAAPHAADPREQEAPCPARSSRRALARLHRTTYLCRRGGWSRGLRKGDGSDGPGAVRYSCGWPGLTASDPRDVHTTLDLMCLLSLFCVCLSGEVPSSQ